MSGHRLSYRQGVLAAIRVIEEREQRVHFGVGGALQPSLTIKEIRERLLA